MDNEMIPIKLEPNVEAFLKDIERLEARIAKLEQSLQQIANMELEIYRIHTISTIMQGIAKKALEKQSHE